MLFSSQLCLTTMESTELTPLLPHPASCGGGAIALQHSNVSCSLFSEINWTAWNSNYTDVSSWIRKTEANILRVWRLLGAITLWWPVLLLGPGGGFCCCTTQEKMESQEQGKSKAHHPSPWSKWRKEFWNMLPHSTTVNRKNKKEKL